MDGFSALATPEDMTHTARMLSPNRIRHCAITRHPRHDRAEHRDMTKPSRPHAPDDAIHQAAPCPVAALAADWAILDDQILDHWSVPENEPEICMALDTWRNAIATHALNLTPASTAGAAFQAYLVSLTIAIADTPDLPPDDRDRHLKAAAKGARNLTRYLTVARWRQAAG